MPVLAGTKMNQEYYDDLPHITRPGKIKFNAETYVGNWYEETVRNTLKRDEFIRQRECGNLKIQKTQTMVDLLLKPVELAHHNDGFLHYGDAVQIVLPGPTCRLATEAFPFIRNYCKIPIQVLSSAVPPEAIDYAPYLSTDSIISASHLLYPVVRNSFIIEHPGSSSNTGGLINFGDVFRIRAFDTQHFPLYLFSAPAIRFHSLATHSAQPLIRFSDLPTQNTLWNIQPLDPEIKLRMELGIPVRLKQPVLIRHNHSGQNLSVEVKYPVLTYFGEEYEVSLDTKVDKRNLGSKTPTFENIWYFDTDRKLSEQKVEKCDEDFAKQAAFSAKINANMVNQSPAQLAKLEAKECGQEEDEEEEDECVQLQCNPCYESQNDGARELECQNEREQEAAFSSVPIDEDRRIPRFELEECTDPMNYTYRSRESALPNRKYTYGEYCMPKIPKLKRASEDDNIKADKCVCVEPGPKPPNPNLLPQMVNRLIQ